MVGGLEIPASLVRMNLLSYLRLGINVPDHK
jgi:hypothetical protein